MQQAWFANKQHKGLSKKLTGFKYFYYKKAAVIFNFCLIGNISHNFLIPRMIELVPKTFMPIRTPDLHRVDISLKYLVKSHVPFPVEILYKFWRFHELFGPIVLHVDVLSLPSQLRVDKR